VRIGDEYVGGIVCSALRRGGRLGGFFLKARSGHFDIMLVIDSVVNAGQSRK
jgi:hypothetical protein